MASNTAESQNAREHMNAMYKWTRHVYDASRKYYLLGRDHLIEHIKPNRNNIVCEVGCGTARNLIKLQKRYPETVFVGLDASDEMLKTAQTNVRKSDLDEQLIIKQSFAQTFDQNTLFNLNKPIDRFVFSYALSIIPPWRESIDHALKLLPEGGEMHIVDFGEMKDQPEWFRKFIFWWLDKFHVYSKPEILEYLKRLEFEKSGTLEVTHLYKGYAYYAVFKKT